VMALRDTLHRRARLVASLIGRLRSSASDYVLWRGTRLPRYAEPFSAMLAAHMRMVVKGDEAADRGGAGDETA
jgi:hypothetical protein